MSNMRHLGLVCLDNILVDWGNGWDDRFIDERKGFKTTDLVLTAVTDNSAPG